MNHRTYQELLPFYTQPRQLNPVAVANPEWMAGWWARHDEINVETDRLMAAGLFRFVKPFLEANPTVRINEETVKTPVPAVVYLNYDEIDALTALTIEF